MRRTLVALLVLLLLIAGCGAGCEIMNRTTYIEGSRVGYIVKFAERGLLWKSYQGEVNMGGVLNGTMGGATLSTWNFSIDNQRRHNENVDSLVAVINRFLSEGKPVKITYTAPFYTWPWRSSNRYLVQSVDVVAGK